MYLTLMSNVAYKSQYMNHTIQFFGKTVTVIHELNSKQRAECTLTGEFTITLDKEGTTVYFESEDDFMQVLTMIKEFSGETADNVTNTLNNVIRELQENNWSVSK